MKRKSFVMVGEMMNREGRQACLRYSRLNHFCVLDFPRGGV